jgi:hypothetical protein
VSDQVEVLRVFDVNDAHTRALYVAWPPLMDWIREHGAEPRNVRRVEVLVFDCPLVRFTEVVRVEDGRVQADRSPDGDGWIIRTVTRDRLLRRMPPERQATL